MSDKGEAVERPWRKIAGLRYLTKTAGLPESVRREPMDFVEQKDLLKSVTRPTGFLILTSS